MENDIIRKNFLEFMSRNRDKVYEIADQQTAKNKDGVPIITKDDPWKEEGEWDEEKEDVYVTDMR